MIVEEGSEGARHLAEIAEDNLKKEKEIPIRFSEHFLPSPPPP